MGPLIFRLMTRFTAWLDPKLAKYRPPKKPEPPFTPKNERDFRAVLKRTPNNILSEPQKAQILAGLDAYNLQVLDIMLPRRKMMFVHTKDVLGPVLLDELHRSGAKIFPVLDKNSQICGMLNRDIFDVSKIAEDSSVLKHLDERVVYVRTDYSIMLALETLLRNSTDVCIVIDEKMRVRGFLTLSTILGHILPKLNDVASDEIDDSDATAVLARNLD